MFPLSGSQHATSIAITLFGEWLDVIIISQLIQFV